MESKSPDETLRMRRMKLNPYILRMLEGIFSLDEAHVFLFIAYNYSFINILTVSWIFLSCRDEMARELANGTFRRDHACAFEQLNGNVFTFW